MRMLVLAAVMLMFVGCARHAERPLVGSLTVKEAVTFYKTLPTVADWLKKTNAIPQRTPDQDTWRITLKDGALLYTEHQVSGVLYVDRLGCDPEEVHSLDILMTELADGLLPLLVHQGLKEPEQMILYSLDPENHAKKLDESVMFHGYSVLGQLQILSANDRRIVAQTIEGAVSAWDGSSMMCFEPRHGIRVTKGAYTFDLLICFECQHIEIYVGEQEDDIGYSIGLTGLPDPLNRILHAANIPLPRQPDDH